MSMFSSEVRKWGQFKDNLTGEVLRFTQTKQYASVQLGIPGKYAKVVISNIEPKTAEQVQLINAMWQMINGKYPKQALICNGVNHCGKTHIACGLVNYLDWCDDALNGNATCTAPSHYHPRYVAEADFLDRITSFRSSTNYFDYYTDVCGVLVLDEFGSCKWTATEARKVNQVLNKRFNNKYQTILLTNRKMSELMELLGDDVQSRFYNCHSITMREAVPYEAHYDDAEDKHAKEWYEDDFQDF